MVDVTGSVLLIFVVCFGCGVLLRTVVGLFLIFGFGRSEFAFMLHVLLFLCKLVD